MTETWELLAACRGARQQCADDIDQIKKTCGTEHGKKHIMECRECYGKLIERLWGLYLVPSEKQWFFRRQEFLEELERMFAEAKEGKTSLEAIECRIEDEKRKWYLQNVRFSPSIRRSIEDLLERRDVLAKAVDERVSFEEVVEEIRSVLSRGLGGSKDSETIMDRLLTENSLEERLQVYKQTFFQASPDEAITEKSQQYLDRLQAGSSMEMIVNKIIADRRSSIGASDQKEKHRKRVEELRRARTAHEHQKTKKKSGRQGSTQSVHPPDSMYDLGPCAVCKRIPDMKDFHACPLCQVLVDAGIRSDAAVFCSLVCSDHGLDKHIEQAHPGCASTNNCVQLVDEDVEMDMDGSGGSCLCRECMDSLKFESVFCSSRCADVNFQRHRESVHIPGREAREVDIKDANDLVFEDEDRTRYHARDIRFHLMPLMDALSQFQQRHGIESLPIE